MLTMVPGRLFERPTTMDPTDSLDCIALQIPRYIIPHQLYEVKIMKLTIFSF